MLVFFFFFFNDTATTEIYTLSLHDALPISARLDSSNRAICISQAMPGAACWRASMPCSAGDRKSTRLNSSHSQISYAVFCLKKKKNMVGSDRVRRTRIIAHTVMLLG